MQKDFLLLQVNDALFPVGGYSHSYGLETYIQKDLVCDEKTALQYISHNLRYSFCYTELLAVRLAYDKAAGSIQNMADSEKKRSASDCAELNCAALDGVLLLEEMLDALKTPFEIRQAARKIGSRFVKTVSALPVIWENDMFARYERASRLCHHTAAYGVFCCSAGLSRRKAMEHFLYAQTSAMVTNCVKTIPLSQTAGQRILTDCMALFEEVLKAAEEADEEMLGVSAPGFAVRCMQHEGLYSRLYMS